MALCKLENWILKISRKTIKKICFQKIFHKKNFKSGRILTPPPVPLYRLKNQKGVFDEFYKIFVKFGLENWKWFILVAARGWYWTCPGACWSFRWSVADRRHIARTPDIPLCQFVCNDLLPCYGYGILLHFSRCISCWSVWAMLQNFRAQKLKAIAS